MAKAKPVTQRKALTVTWTDLMHDALAVKNTKIIGPMHDVFLTFDPTGMSAYTKPEKDNKFRVVLGGGMVAKVANLPPTFVDKEQFSMFFNDIVFAFYGLDYHELGHDKFTDMHSRFIIDYPKTEYIPFLKRLANTLEDPKEEMCLSAYFDINYPKEINPKEFFDFMIERLFLPQCPEYKDTKNANSFMNYLLLVLRCGVKEIPNHNEIWDKYSSSFMPLLKDAMLEDDPTERLKKQIAFGEWLIENITEIDWTFSSPIDEDDVRAGKGDPSFGGSGGGFAPSPGVSHSKGEEEDLDKKLGAHSTASSARPEDTEGDDEGEEDTEDEDESSGSTGGDDDTEDEDEADGSDDDSDDDEEEEPEETYGHSEPDETIDDIESIDDVFNDMFSDGDYHEWIIAKDEYCCKDGVIEKINEQIDEFSDIVNDISKFLNLFKGRIKPRELSGFTHGKLNILRAMQDELSGGSDVKLFNQSIRRGKAPDLAVSLVCDNSGSMSGEKSYICSRATLALAQACEYAKIPFECNAFTKTSDCYDGTCITIHIKDFDETLEQAKPYFAINDSSLIGHLSSGKRIPTFCGNSEEVNIFYIGEKFKRNPHKTKLMFVLCDGCTTGSTADLIRVVKNLAEEGIIVIGLGIYDHEVSSIYPISEIFPDRKSLDGLAQYLIDTLSEYAK